jgi:uncharacterized membrane protein YgcG
MRRIMPIALLGMAIAATPLFGDQAPRPVRPGAVNYVEGKAFLDGSELSPQSIGNAEMNAGQELTTEQGKAEILLTPGVFLRVGQNSAVKMISPAITPTTVQINHGRAALEVDELHKENNLEVIVNGVTTHIVKTGYYEFNADQPSVRVFKGQAMVDQGNGKFEKVKGSHELALMQGVHAKNSKFNTDDAQDALYDWSKLRSQYLAEENQQIAGEYAGSAGFTPGWYPYGYGYTFIGADPFFSPFGWGFYPPRWGGFYPGGYWGGYYGGVHRGFHGPVGRYGDRDHGFRGRMGDHDHGSQGGRGSQGGTGVRGGVNGGGGFHGGGAFHGGVQGRGSHR